MTKSTMTVNDEGTKLWKNEEGELHRADGPAVEWSNGVTSWYYKNNLLGYGLAGFWRLWDRLDEEARQNINLHMWLRKLKNV